MKNLSTRSNPMIMIGLIVAMILLIGAIVISATRPASSDKVVHLAAGEWAPYVGESLPDNGVAAAIVELVFKQMGYQTQLQFMPWTLVQNRAEQSQTNRQIRGIFPYIHSQQREGQFYFSDGIIDITYGVFYHVSNTPEAKLITQHQDLKQFSIITLQGYKYAQEIQQYLPQFTCDQKDTMQGLEALEQNLTSVIISFNDFSDELVAVVLSGPQTGQLGGNNDKLFKLSINPAQLSDKLTWTGTQNIVVYGLGTRFNSTDFSNKIDEYQLIMTSQTAQLLDLKHVKHSCITDDEASALVNLAYLSKPKVMIEAIQVAENILSSSLPELAPYIQRSSYSKPVPHRMMFPKNNPNNLGLRDQFNLRLNELRSNQQAYDKLVRTTVNKIQLSTAVSLVATSGNTLVNAGVFDQQMQTCQFDPPVFFPNGSKASVRQWSSVFLRAKQDGSRPYVLARILNGPLAGSPNLYCFAPEAIKLQ
ncbi:hypothetical protein [Aliiglaciecola litoralis]|uniref:Solute-binding protein family 3/N-terminal domain-containing protein n=1 Tax=Aliiglaciecola litoralis TaxID=582857 RepID=A0ABN1LKL1_9ALTE